MKKNQKYVVRCLKATAKYGFGHRYKAGQFVTYSGKPSNDLQQAHVYENNLDNGCCVDDLEGWEDHFRFVPVAVSVISP